MGEFTNMAQQYSLKWNNHQPNFISMFALLRNTQTLIDVTLAAEGQHLHCHKTVLSACSPYFHSLFVENPSHHPIVILKDVTFADLRTIVDFMYYGEVNITQEELPQMLNSAKSLKVKGLTETEPTSVMRSQSSEYSYEQSGEVSEDQSSDPRHDVTGEQAREPSSESTNEEMHEIEPQRRQTPSPNESPVAKRRRCRKSSNLSMSVVGSEENRGDNAMEIASEHITLSSVTPRRREFLHEDNTQQNSEPQNINIDDLNVDHNSAGMPQELMASLRLRRSKHLTRQARVEARAAPRQCSEPAPLLPPPLPAPPLRKHHSYPQLAAMMRRQQQQVGSLLIRAVTVVDRRGGSGGGSGGAGASSAEGPTPRASHTPAVRSGPPLSCNFCWNTVDESGRILRRKTQYHCPECRTNLCIVPCFHEYHDAETELASVR